MKIVYQKKKFRPESLILLFQSDDIIKEYAAQGFDLTLRQLYYQLVSRDIIPNNIKSYNKLKQLISNGRLAGYIDWDAIVDRTRLFKKPTVWGSPGEIIEACADQYAVDQWEDQPVVVEVWIEKDALTGVFEGICDRYQVPLFACRGYVSQSAQWRAARRIAHRDKGTVILHFGDHDPSGTHMTEDIGDRLRMLDAGDDNFQVIRCALNMDQIDQYNPPPNPAKESDSRWPSYVATYQTESSWELDAISPRNLERLVEDRLHSIMDLDAWQDAERRTENGRELLADAVHWIRAREEDDD